MPSEMFCPQCHNLRVRVEFEGNQLWLCRRCDKVRLIAGGSTYPRAAATRSRIKKTERSDVIRRTVSRSRDPEQVSEGTGSQDLERREAIPVKIELEFARMFLEGKTPTDMKGRFGFSKSEILPLWNAFAYILRTLEPIYKDLPTRYGKVTLHKETAIFLLREVDNVVAMRNKRGEATRHIAISLGIPPLRVYRHLKRQGRRSLFYERSHLTEKQKRILRRSHAKQKSIKYTAHKAKVGQETVVRFWKEHCGGLPNKRMSLMPSKVEKGLALDFLSDKSPVESIRRRDVPKSTVHEKRKAFAEVLRTGSPESRVLINGNRLVSLNAETIQLLLNTKRDMQSVRQQPVSLARLR